MFFRKSPCCHAPVESAESDSFDHGSRAVSHTLHQQAMAGHPHPYMKMAAGALSLGRAIYKRVPGGGLKRCTNCHHEFR